VDLVCSAGDAPVVNGEHKTAAAAESGCQDAVDDSQDDALTAHDATVNDTTATVDTSGLDVTGDIVTVHVM